MTFARLRTADWVAFVAALALLFTTAADWYSTDMEARLSAGLVGGCVVGCGRGAGGAARAEGPVWSTAGSD